MRARSNKYLLAHHHHLFYLLRAFFVLGLTKAVVKSSDWFSILWLGWAGDKVTRKVTVPGGRSALYQPHFHGEALTHERNPARTPSWSWTPQLRRA